MFTSFPTWAYGPALQSGVFERAEDIPDGWVDDPAKVEEAGTPPVAEIEALGKDLHRVMGPDVDLPLISADPIPSPIYQFTDEDLPPVEELEFTSALHSHDNVLPETSPGPAAKVKKLGKGRAAAQGELSPDVRADAIAAIRGAGGDVSDKAPDGEIIAALNSLED